MSSSLLEDVYAVWGEGESALPCDVILPRLKSLSPRIYAAWDAHSFGRAMTAAGAPTKTIRFGAGTRRGVALDSLRDARQLHDQVVYFVERHGFVKIGTTQNLAARIASIDRGSAAIPGMTLTPVSVLAVMPGGHAVERAIHALFEHLRYDGEWFLLDGPLVPFVKAIAEARGSAACDT
jgi:hypothetical protein